MVTFYKRVSDTIWTSLKGGCGCSGGGTVSYTALPGTSVYNKSAVKLSMTINGRYYEFLPMKIALGVRVADALVATQNPSLELYTLDFLNHTGVQGYVA